MPAKCAASPQGCRTRVAGFVLALLAALMLLLSLAAPVAAAAGVEAVTIEICSEAGSETIEIAGETDPDKPGGCPCLLCLCCLPGAWGGATLPPESAASPPVMPVRALVCPDIGIPVLRSGVFRPVARGPPAIERGNMIPVISVIRLSAGATARTMGAPTWS